MIRHWCCLMGTWRTCFSDGMELGWDWDWAGLVCLMRLMYARDAWYVFFVRVFYVRLGVSFQLWRSGNLVSLGFAGACFYHIVVCWFEVCGFAGCSLMFIFNWYTILFISSRTSSS